MPLFGSCWNCSRFLYVFFFCSLLPVRLSGCSLQPSLSGFIVIKREASGHGMLWFACKFSHWIFPLMSCTATTCTATYAQRNVPAALGTTKMVRVRSTLDSVLMDVLSDSRVVQGALLFCLVFFLTWWPTLPFLLLTSCSSVTPNVYTTPRLPQTHPMVMKYPLLPGRAEPLKMPAEWENTHCLVQGRFLWGEALKGDGCRGDAALHPVSAEWRWKQPERINAQALWENLI